MMRKLERILRVVALVGAIFGFWALGLNQLSQFVENGKQDNLAYVEALAGCIEYKAPHVIFVGDTPYCYMTYNGTDIIAPLEKLQASNP